MQYEYKTRFLPARIIHSGPCACGNNELTAEMEKIMGIYDRVLNEMAREKWELISASPVKLMPENEGRPQMMTACIFKRQWHRQEEEPVLRD